MVGEAVVRGVPSPGMLCSEKELGISEEHGSIIELTSEFAVGEDLAERLSDTVLELALTPNLGHCLSMEGIARELAAVYGTRAKRPKRPTLHHERTGGWQLVDEALGALPALAEKFEIIAVDDGSRDRTPAIADELTNQMRMTLTGEASSLPTPVPT